MEYINTDRNGLQIEQGDYVYSAGLCQVQFLPNDKVALIPESGEGKVIEAKELSNYELSTYSIIKRLDRAGLLPQNKYLGDVHDFRTIYFKGFLSNSFEDARREFRKTAKGVGIGYRRYLEYFEINCSREDGSYLGYLRTTTDVVNGMLRKAFQSTSSQKEFQAAVRDELLKWIHQSINKGEL